jgi:hypothetical protein
VLNGVPVGELTPLRRRQFVASDVVRAVFANAPSVDVRRFREDLDRVAEAGAAPRA